MEYRLLEPNLEVYRLLEPNLEVYRLLEPNLEVYRLLEPNLEVYRLLEPNLEYASCQYAATHTLKSHCQKTHFIYLLIGNRVKEPIDFSWGAHRLDNRVRLIETILKHCNLDHVSKELLQLKR